VRHIPGSQPTQSGSSWSAGKSVGKTGTLDRRSSLSLFSPFARSEENGLRGWFCASGPSQSSQQPPAAGEGGGTLPGAERLIKGTRRPSRHELRSRSPSLVPCSVSPPPCRHSNSALPKEQKAPLRAGCRLAASCVLSHMIYRSARLDRQFWAPAESLICEQLLAKQPSRWAELPVGAASVAEIRLASARLAF
jgi:hypothetical protein